MGWFKDLKVHPKEWVVLGLCIISLIVAIFSYPMMPETMASHWGADGNVNGYMSAFWGTFILPIVIFVLFFVLFFVPRADPMRKNIEKFNESFLNFVIVIFLFMLCLQGFVTLWNLGYKIDIAFVFVILFSILFFFMSVMLSKAKQNMTIGIRTPWTLKSEKVWDKTHEKSAIAAKIISVLFLLGLIFKKQAFIIVIVLLIWMFFYAFFYSYLIYRKENKSLKNRKKKE